MKKNIAIAMFTLAIFGLGVSAAALADTVTISNVQDNGHSYGPYTLTLTNSTDPILPNGTISAVCDDAADTVTSSDIWNANVETLQEIISDPTGAGELFQSNTAGLTTPEAYEAAAYLVNAILNGPSSQWQNLNDALWALFDSSVSSTGADATDYNDAVNFAKDVALGTASLSSLGDYTYLILTPDPTTQCLKSNSWGCSISETPQEYFTRVDSPVPESSTVVLLGLGLAAFAAIAVSRRRFFTEES